MDDVLVPGTEMDMEFIEQNPEAIFDLITMKSMQQRYRNIESPCGSSHDRYFENEAVYQNEVEFETFVQQFPIDDSIAQCFAAATGSVPLKQETKFVSGGKRPQVATKYSKLKKKFGFRGSDDTSLISEDEVKSRDSKRSKKGGGVFSKRHKWRSHNNTNKKTVNFSDQSERSGSENTSDTATVSQQVDFQSVGDDANRTDSCSVSDSQITSFSETFNRRMDQTVPVGNEGNQSKIPVRHSGPLQTNTFHSTSFSSKRPSNKKQDVFSAILSGHSTEIMQKIEDMQPDDVLKLRDYHGNNLLHRSVLGGNADVIKYIMEKFPEINSEMNQENETAIEMAARFGKYHCLKVMLERNQKRNSLGVSLLNRLLCVCAQNGQADCLSLLLTYMTRDPLNTSTLPGDARGNTAAHIAARHGHIHCLQALVASGYDVSSKNSMQQRPLHVAHQSRSYVCFEYLLLLNVCEELLSSLRTNMRLNMRLAEQMSSVKPSLEHIKLCLKRYGDLCSETNQLLKENKNSILQTLNNLQQDLQLFVQHTSMNSAAKRKEARDKLEEFSTEIERLEDIFEFSPLSEMDGTLSKLLSSVDDGILPSDDGIKSDKMEDNSTLLCSLIRDIHKEYMLENWDTRNVYEKYLKVPRTSPGINDESSTVNYENIHKPNNMKENHILKSQKPKQELDKSRLVKAPVKNTFKNVLNTTESVVENQSTDTTLNYIDKKQRPTSHTPKLAAFSEGEKTQLSPGDDSREHDIKLQHITYNAGPEVGEFTLTTDLSDNPVVIDKFSDDNKVDIDENEKSNPTERPFTKLLSLDERIELLIAGERAKENESDPDHVGSSAESKDSNLDGVGSIYTSTFTSVTSDTSGGSDWYSKLGFTSLETTSSDEVTVDTTTDTASYWWDIGDDHPDAETRNLKVSFPFGNDIRRKIHLNLENDGSTYDELREHRLRTHLRSVQQTRFSSDSYRECITTSTGEVMGGFQLEDNPEHIQSFKSPAHNPRVVIDVNGALRERNNSHKTMPRPKRTGQRKLFTLEDAIATKPMSETEFRERYGRHASRTSGLPDMRWENMSITDEEEENSWLDYDRGYGIRSDTGTTSGSHTPQSYV